MRKYLAKKHQPILALGSIAASAFLLSQCSRDTTPDLIFSTPEQCIASGMDRLVCQAGYQDAVHSNLTKAPQFSSLAQCEGEFGEKKCVERPAGTPTAFGTHSGIFVPIMSGYLLSSAFTNINDYQADRRRRQEEEDNAGGSAGGAFGSSAVYQKRNGDRVIPSSMRGDRQGMTTLERGQHSINPVKVVSRRGFGTHMRGGG
ncbi:DUF1190 domain-containing protein [Rhizobium sp. NFR03]|uniref:DUF1190 domain-containing protein n=1 Tax=Rhizobium sp. NFR03 TaxID=1566263 RepID=UPI0008C6263A|nr:DUF1190 domain-containing protein [Rhizobium sp. NFR03]SES45984.1 Uncharacterized conserved protein YgiB, involved in bioifilm formation, UPF0441/DUF1190 family [Rhizobium sp. NFR03]